MFSRSVAACRAVIAVFVVLATLQAQDSLLQSGPMLGYVHTNAAAIWVQTKQPAQVQIEYSAEGEKTRRSSIYNTTPASHLTATLFLEDLNDGVTYNYKVLINGKVVDRPYPLKFKTHKIWLFRTDPPPVHFAVGSCLYINDPPYDRPGTPYGAEFEILAQIAAAKPEFMLWMGDNVYLREPDLNPPRMAYRYRHTRAFPALQALLAACPNYAIWDDHDYGPNDANRSFQFKGESLSLFKAYWPNPSYGLPETPGVFFNFEWSDAEFFMLDDRYYRAPEASNDPAKPFLGSQQLQWLKDALETSHATFKFVVCGNQVVNYNSYHETYSHYPNEFNDFTSWLNKSGISGVIFLSGDRHFTEIVKITRPENYPLYEFTSSPLTSGMSWLQGIEMDNPITVDGTRVTDKRNFGIIDIDGPRHNRVLTIQTIDSEGKLRFTFKLNESDLKKPTSTPHTE